MNSNSYMVILFYLILDVCRISGFIPHPLIAYGALSSTSITHAEITELAVIRSVARYFYDTRIRPNHNNESFINEEEYLTAEHTIDELYQLAYPEYDALRISFYSLPLKFILDSIITQNVLVDFDETTKKVSAAHFDNEAFVNASRRILRLRQMIIDDIKALRQDWTHARDMLGQLFHTLQDFYSHSNWIEMGKTEINEFIGFNETIGLIAQQNQSTCTNSGCTKIEKPCTLWQQITIDVCPLVYYDCQNNILQEINDQELLTSGYAAHDVSENNELLEKPTNVEKCSHGSVLDESSHIPAIGGINKDSYSLVFSPHANLHKQAADLALKATERFVNDLRRDIGDENYDNLLAINPSITQCELASNAVSQGKRFRFFIPNLATSLKDDYLWWTAVRRLFNRLIRLIKSIWTGNYFTEDDINKPTYDLSDKGVNIKDLTNFRAAPYIIGKEELKRKKRMIDFVRKRRYL